MVTGEPQFVAATVKDLLGADDIISSVYEINNDIFTGKLSQSLATREDKDQAISQIVSNYYLEDSFAFGDSEADIDMLRLVKNPFCINPTPALKKVALELGWHITTPDEIESQVKKILP